MFFKKKNENEIPVIHYEGISSFSQDYPCKLIVHNEFLEIIRMKPKTKINLSKNKIIRISSMEESRFMLKYHGDKAKTNKITGSKKFYLVIDYISKENIESKLVFWGTSFEYNKFNDLQNNYIQTNSHSIEL